MASYAAQLQTELTYAKQCIRELESENTRLRKAYDDPELDATDGAHPAWWRGHDHTTKVFCQKVNEILDGKDSGHGTANEPWESTRRRIMELVRRYKHIDVRNHAISRKLANVRKAAIEYRRTRDFYVVLRNVESRRQESTDAAKTS
jgi:hypothetical protein